MRRRHDTFSIVFKGQEGGTVFKFSRLDPCLGRSRALQREVQALIELGTSRHETNGRSHLPFLECWGLKDVNVENGHSLTSYNNEISALANYNAGAQDAGQIKHACAKGRKIHDVPKKRKEASLFYGLQPFLCESSPLTLHP